MQCCEKHFVPAFTFTFWEAFFFVVVVVVVVLGFFFLLFVFLERECKISIIVFLQIFPNNLYQSVFIHFSQFLLFPFYLSTLNFFSSFFLSPSPFSLFLCISISLSIYLSNYLFIYLLSIHLSTHLSLFLGLFVFLSHLAPLSLFGLFPNFLIFFIKICV